MQLFKYLTALTFFGLFCLACNENTNKIDVNIDQGYEYFPLGLGKYWVYQVDSIVYDTTGNRVERDTARLFVREEIVDSFVDNSGRPAFRIERSIRYADTEAWRVKDVWMAVRSDDQAERVEENLRFVKLVFPLIQGTTWNGNLFIDETTQVIVAGESIEMFKNWSYELQSLGLTENIGGQSFENVATVLQADSENLIELRYAKEKYGRDIGLIYRELQILDTQNITESEPWEEKAQKGFILTQQLIEYN